MKESDPENENENFKFSDPFWRSYCLKFSFPFSGSETVLHSLTPRIGYPVTAQSLGSHSPVIAQFGRHESLPGSGDMSSPKYKLYFQEINYLFILRVGTVQVGGGSGQACGRAGAWWGMRSGRG